MIDIHVCVCVTIFLVNLCLHRAREYRGNISSQYLLSHQQTWLLKLRDTQEKWKRTLQNTVFRSQRLPSSATTPPKGTQAFRQDAGINKEYPWSSGPITSAPVTSPIITLATSGPITSSQTLPLLWLQDLSVLDSLLTPERTPPQDLNDGLGALRVVLQLPTDPYIIQDLVTLYTLMVIYIHPLKDINILISIQRCQFPLIVLWKRE